MRGKGGVGSRPSPVRPGRSEGPPRLASAALVAAGLAAALAGCGGGADSEAAAAPAPVAVEGAVAEIDTITVRVSAVGSLEAQAQVALAPETSGRVTGIRFEEGEEVEAGRILVVLNEEKLQAEVASAAASLQRARAEAANLRLQVRRNDTLLVQGAISRQAYDDLKTALAAAEADVAEAEADLRLARQRLEDARVRAPFAGRTGARLFDLGAYVQEGQELVTLVDDDPLEIDFTVPERYLGQLRVGRPVTVRVRSMPDRSFRGTVSFVSPYVEAGNRTVRLKALIPNPALELTPGQFASVELEMEERAAVVIPEAAIVARQDADLVFRVVEGRVRQTPVRPGYREPGRVEVLSGISAGDTVIVAGQQKVRDGDRVRVSLLSRVPGEPDAGGPAVSGGAAAGGGQGAAEPGG